MKPSHIFQLKIVLEGSKPSIWRRIAVSSEATFFDLHAAIQDAFGWEGGHLHQFFLGNPQKRGPLPQTIGWPDPVWGEPNDLDEREEHLSKHLKKPKDAVWYEYDFGDSWMHSVTLEAISDPEPRKKYPELLGGAGACPWEDCGGLGGYYDMLEAIADPKHPEHDGIVEWTGIENPADFDPKYFDPASVKFQNPQKLLKQYGGMMM